MESQHRKVEIDRNYDAFVRVLGSIIEDHRDQLALMRDGRIEGFYDTPRQALIAASEMFPDGRWSIQDVTDEPIDLGFWSHLAS